MLYEDNEYINECNYKIHYDMLEEASGDLNSTVYNDSGLNTPPEIYKDTFYNSYDENSYNNIDVYIIKTSGTLGIKSDGVSGTVIKKIAPNLYKYIRLTPKNTINE